MTAEQLLELLTKSQEPLGYFFATDRERVMDLLGSLLINKERYGYMCCPCRLASGDRDKDRDIICPCEYRKADVEEFGKCYCGLYVSKEWAGKALSNVYVPERRPPERFF